MIEYAIFGGSFDPIHIGHRRILEAALDYKDFARLFLIPTSGASYKERALSLAIHRYVMCELASQDLPAARLSRLELKQVERPNYTALSLLKIRQKLAEETEGEFSIYLIYGSDVLEHFEHWYLPEVILQNAKLLIALRGDDLVEEERCRAKARYLEERFGGSIDFFPMQNIEISSTRLRENLQQDIVERQYFPPAVADFLEQHKIYKFFADYQALDSKTHSKLRWYEKKIWTRMPQRRLIHVANVALYACHLARVHGVDPNKAAIAGLLHDSCKNIPLDLQIKYLKKSGFAYSYNAAIAHGPASAYWNKQALGVEDPDIYAAVMYHTTARGKMSDLEKIIYLADKCEFGRSFERLEPIRSLAEENLDAAMKLCLEEVAQALARSASQVHELTQEAMDDISAGYQDRQSIHN